MHNKIMELLETMNYNFRNFYRMIHNIIRHKYNRKKIKSTACDIKLSDKTIKMVIIYDVDQ